MWIIISVTNYTVLMTSTTYRVSHKDARLLKYENFIFHIILPILSSLSRSEIFLIFDILILKRASFWETLYLISHGIINVLQYAFTLFFFMLFEIIGLIPVVSLPCKLSYVFYGRLCDVYSSCSSIRLKN